MKTRQLLREFYRRLPFALFGATAFTIMGFLIPGIYYTYFDTTDYITYSQPVRVNERVYKPCDPVVLTSEKDARINVQAFVLRELVLVEQDQYGNERKVRAYTEDVSTFIQQEKDTVSVVYRLPCDIVEGTYYWKANIIYKYLGGNHTYSWISERFDVVVNL